MVTKDRLKPFIPLGTTLLLGLILFILVDDFVVAVIVKPLLRLVWFFSVILQSIPQGALWAVFIVALLAIVSPGFRKNRKPYASPWVTHPSRPGPVEKWAQLLENRNSSNYSKWRLAQKLKLLTQVLLSPVNIREKERLDIPDLDLPEEISAYLVAQLDPRVPFWKRLARKNLTALDLDPEVVLQHLKERLDL